MVVLGEVIGVGSRATVYACGNRRVAKVPLGTTPDAWIRAEAAHTIAVRAAGVRVPEVLDVVEVDGRAVAVYERIDGPSLWSIAMGRSASATDVGEQLAVLHASVLQTPAPLTLPRQFDRMAAKLRRAAGLTGAAALTSAPKASDTAGTALCHGDLHPGNVLASDDGPVLIDWFDASVGHPIADIARTSLLIGAGGPTASAVPHLPGSTPALLAALHDSYLATMSGLIVIAPDDLARDRRVQAAARLSEGVAAEPLLAVCSGAAG